MVSGHSDSMLIPEMLRLSIDQHPLEVVEADDTAIWGPTVHELPVAVGQRYSIIVSTIYGTVGDAFWMRASVGAGEGLDVA